MLDHTHRPRPSLAARAALACAAALTLAAVPAAQAAAPLQATSFVRGTPAVSNATPGPIREIAGDLDADGRDDMVFANGTTAWLVWGTAPPADLDLNADLGSRGVRISGGSFGTVTAVDRGGDIDGDGVDDLLVGTDTAVFVIYGSTTRRTAAVTLGLTAGTTRITRSKGYEDDIAGIGDFNGDGFDDVALQRSASGAAIVLGGPRAATISATAAGARTSLVNAIQRCFTRWWVFRDCTSLGVNFSPVGDFDGDGKDDLAIESGGFDGDAVLYGRTGTFTIPVTAPTQATKLPYAEGLSRTVNRITRAGDVDGDGLDDLVSQAKTIVHGRRGRPAAIAATSPLVRIDESKLITPIVEAIGDQNGDGRDDLALHGYGPAGPVRIVTAVPAAPGTLDPSLGAPVAGIPNDVGGVLQGGGDVDGDGLGDLLVDSPYPGESTFVLTHGTGSTGGSEQVASLQGAVRLSDALGRTIAGATVSLRSTCGERTTTTALPEPTRPTPIGQYPAGDRCTVTPTVVLPNPGAYASCVWIDAYSIGYQRPLQAAESFELQPGLNQWMLDRRCG